jgi:hypothetical protein
MLDKLLSDVRTLPQWVPSLVGEQSNRLASAVSQIPVVAEVVATTASLRERRAEARRWVQGRAYTLRTDAESRAFDLSLKALDAGRTLLDQASATPQLAPVIGTVEGPARAFFDRLTAAATTPSVAGYDELAVRDILKTLHALSHPNLLRVRHHEAGNKNRKTILDAIQRELDKRARVAATS